MGTHSGKGCQQTAYTEARNAATSISHSFVRAWIVHTDTLFASGRNYYVTTGNGLDSDC